MLAQLTDSLTHIINSLYISTGLLGIILAMALESCCTPLPSEIVMPLAGIMIATKQHLPGLNPAWPLWLNLVLVGLAGAVGCLLGSMAAYGIGYSGGRTLMLKYGRYLLISQHDADKADHFFQKWGSATAFFSRLLPIVRTYISLPAGIAKMPFVKFCVYSFLGSFPWCIVLAYLGYQLGNNLSTIGPIFKGLDVFVVVVVVILLVLYIWRHIRNDNKARAEHAAKEANLQQPWTNSPPLQEQNQPSQFQQGRGGPQVQPSQQQWPQYPQQSQEQQPQTPSQPTQPSQQQSGQQQQFQQGWSQQHYPQQPQQGWPPQADDRTIRRQ